METFKIQLSNGSLANLADGVKMDVNSSIIELADNAYDAEATEINIVIDNAKHYLCIFSKEKNNNLTKDKARSILYSLGQGQELKTKQNGIGKYNQGFKYAGPYLIGKGNHGIVSVDCIPNNGEAWSTEQPINYLNGESYSDTIVNFVPFKGIKNGYNFKVEIIGCRNITPTDITKLKIILGIRYRKKISSKEILIKINNDSIEPIDRLYQHLGKRVNYNCQWFSYKGRTNAAKYEWSDLKIGNIQENELCKYDTSLGINRRESGVNVRSRSGVEIAINDVTIINEGELENLCGTELQPSSAGFKGRLTIYDTELADTYIKGGNKSSSIVDKSFAINQDTKEISTAIKDSNAKFISMHHKDRKEYVKIYTPSYIKNWPNFSLNICFINDDDDVNPITLDHNKDRILVNRNHKWFKSLNTDENISKIVLSLIRNCKTISEAYSIMYSFFIEWESNESK